MSKLALLIGCNYTGTKSELKGCHNDILKFNDILLNNYGYKKENITILLDKDNYIYPTKKYINENMKLLAENSIKNNIEEVLFYYSGHGTQEIDIDNDEFDGKDEAIIPLDYLENGIIVDDNIYEFLKSINTNTKIICVFDSCNSASCSNLPILYTYNNGKIKKEIYGKRENLNKNIYIISGCSDNKFSYDIKEPDDTPCGLLSYGIRKTLLTYSYSCTISQLLDGLTVIIKQLKLEQKPVISVGSSNIKPTNFIFIKNNVTQIKKTNKNLKNNSTEKKSSLVFVNNKLLPKSKYKDNSKNHYHLTHKGEHKLDNDNTIYDNKQENHNDNRINYTLFASIAGIIFLNANLKK